MSPITRTYFLKLVMDGVSQGSGAVLHGPIAAAGAAAGALPTAPACLGRGEGSCRPLAGPLPYSRQVSIYRIENIE